MAKKLQQIQFSLSTTSFSFATLEGLKRSPRSSDSTLIKIWLGKITLPEMYVQCLAKKLDFLANSLMKWVFLDKEFEL